MSPILTRTPDLARIARHADLDLAELAGIDLDYRPPTYFGTSEEMLASILGDERRESVRAELAAGHGDEIPDALFASELEPGLLKAVGRVHPRFMSGEYLPPLLEHEVEVARLRLDSTTGDVVAVRARPDAEGVRYRVVDEYQDSPYEGAWSLPFETSPGPLSLAELIDALDHAVSDTMSDLPLPGLVACHWPDLWEYHGDADEVRSFTTVRSEFYPGIGDWYDLVCAAWCLEQADAVREPDAVGRA